LASNVKGADMKKLEYTLKNDMLFKTLFVKYPDLLESLVAGLLGIPQGSITEFIITNTELPSEALGDKFCRLDINMVVNGQKVDLEVQVADQGNFRERALYYWSLGYCSSLEEGHDYLELPQVVVIGILAFSLFGCKEYHSEFRPLEVSRHEVLTDKQCLHFFELPKLPGIDANNEHTSDPATLR